MTEVLIVEDKVIVAHDLETHVERRGHSVCGVAGDAATAVKIAEERQPDIALIDIRLNGDRDGVTLAAHLREFTDTKIIFITSHADDKTLKRVSAIKPSGFILKPFSGKSVDAAIEIALADDRPSDRKVDLKALSTASSDGKLSDSEFDKVTEFVAKNFDRAITLEELASHAGMGRSKFARLFKSRTGTSPYQYIMQERLDESKRLLRDTSWPLAEIAAAVGFSSQSHFATAFKKTIGITPLAYRRLG